MVEIELKDLQKALEAAWGMGFASGTICDPKRMERDLLMVLTDALMNWKVEQMRK